MSSVSEHGPATEERERDRSETDPASSARQWRAADPAATCNPLSNMMTSQAQIAVHIVFSSSLLEGWDTACAMHSHCYPKQLYTGLFDVCIALDQARWNIFVHMLQGCFISSSFHSLTCLSNRIVCFPCQLLLFFFNWTKRVEADNVKHALLSS